MKVGIKRPSPSMIVAVIALIVALSGSAYALSVPRNSIGSRQIKAKAVTTGKIANGAVTGVKIAEGTITGANISMASLGTVPKAAEAAKANLAAAIGTEREPHSASCPANTTLIHGVCFDSTANEPAQSQKEAADLCAAKGGWLPSPMELYAIRGVINLGAGGPEHVYTNEVYGNTNGGNYRTVVVDGTGAISESEVNAPSRYVCAYTLVR